MHFIFFIFILPTIVFLILLYNAREKKDDTESPTEHIEVCAICQNDFPLNQLVEKEIGTYGKIYCFCGECIKELQEEYNSTIRISSGE